MSIYITYSDLLHNRDLNRREFWVLLPLAILTLLLGIFPNYILDILHSSVINLTTFL
jgi:NADH-ubiquinone oxidoreductase chain 4